MEASLDLERSRVRLMRLVKHLASGKVSLGRWKILPPKGKEAKGGKFLAGCPFHLLFTFLFVFPTGSGRAVPAAPI